MTEAQIIDAFIEELKACGYFPIPSFMETTHELDIEKLELSPNGDNSH